MQTIGIKQLGFGVGAACGLFYVGCVLLMLVLPHDLSVRFFNSLLHGWDVESLMWDAPWLEVIVGLLETLVLGWIFGALIAVIYNLGAKPAK